ncbi:MAG: 2,3,4,5-tetrahydropyridine-2,6-dicarboxylate N-succinyltransferase, partial [Stenotrophomonas nitritireducens]|nr:2,3,4,5-tetrahydropyridine-2,6-dicarboxylate N-succinyltransferase [Stenotrophomonas nitritireducens]
MATRKTPAKKTAPNKTAPAPKPAASKAVPAKKAAKAVVKTAPGIKPKAAPKAVESIGPRSLRKPPAPGVAEMKFGIESAFERRAMLTMDEIEGYTRPLVNRVIDGLESGEFRVAEPDGNGGWKVNEWLKKAVLLYFRVNDMSVMDGRPAPFWDKVES